MNMKKNYDPAEIEIIKFEAKDVIATSGGSDNNNSNIEGEDPGLTDGWV